MIINTIYGSITVVNCDKNQDKLAIVSKEKEVLMRIFGAQRIKSDEVNPDRFKVEMCKQEFAHTLIMLVKEIEYADFSLEMAEMEILKNRILA